MLELLSLQTNGIGSDDNRNEIQKKTIERLRQDEVMLVEWRQKAKKLEEKLESVQTSNATLRMNMEAEKQSLRHNIEELEFNNRELHEHVKVVNADMKYLNIVMIGKDAIIEKQVPLHAH
jgi:hypothetical protein